MANEKEKQACLDIANDIRQIISEGFKGKDVISIALEQAFKEWLDENGHDLFSVLIEKMADNYTLNEKDVFIKITNKEKK